jgi:hypothetical protein
MTEEQIAPIGVRISAGLLFFVGATAVLPFIFCIYLFGNCLAGRDSHGATAATLVVAALNGAFIVLCIRGASAMHRGRRWGASVATAMGFCLLALSAPLTFDYFHPERQSADEYFLIMLVPLFVAVGLWWCVYLNLPHARAYLRSLERH